MCSKDFNRKLIKKGDLVCVRPSYGDNPDDDKFKKQYKVIKTNGIYIKILELDSPNSQLTIPSVWVVVSE